MQSAANEADNSFGSLLRDYEKSQTIKQEAEDFERRKRQLQYEAQLQEERDRLDRERRERMAAEDRQTLPSLPDLNKIPKWGQIASGQKYKSLPDADKQVLKNKYFDEVIAPHAKAAGANIEQERLKFLNADTSLVERFLQFLTTYWKYSLTFFVLLPTVFFRKKLLNFGGYLVENAFRISALAVTIMCAVIIIRSFHEPILTLLIR